MEVEANPNSAKKKEKIVKVLYKLLEPNFKIRNDVYLNLLLTHLVGKNGEKKIWQNDEQLQEQFCQWIIRASDLWARKKANQSATILSFTLNLASQLSAEEQIFVKLNSQDVYECLVGMSQTNSMDNPAVALSLVNLLCSFLEHKTGLEWVVATTYRTDVITLSLKAHTMYIRKKANFAENLVRKLIKPLSDVFKSLPMDKNTQHRQIESTELYETLKPSLDLILEINETLLKKFNKKVLQLFLEAETQEIMKKMLLLSRTEDFSFQLLQIQFVLLFYLLREKLDGVKVVPYDSLSIIEIRTMFDLITNEMDKCYVKCVVKICDFAHALFCCLAPCMPMFIKKGITIEFQNQLVLFQLGPVFSLGNQFITQEKVASLFQSDIFRSEFYAKCFRISTVQTIKMCYKWIESLALKPDLDDDAVFCLQYVVKMKKLLSRERAAMVFSCLVYTFFDALVCLKEHPGLEMSRSRLLFLCTLVESMVDYAESFDLTWKDSIETIRVMDLAYDFLEYPYWNDKMIVIKGLKLLKSAISQYMSPDMVLLIYSSVDSKVSQTGNLLYAKCHDSSWEIRDSALEVVHTLSLNAASKFPEYTSILLNAGLPQLVVNMALKDGEYYVRATSFRCLQELIQIPEIWDKLLNMDKFLENMLSVFENETEGVVRKEAAALIYKIDKYQNFPENLLSRLYDVMTHAALGDLHWEVKHNALDFWFNLWEQHLNQQGMIDHEFPSHTFSKEHKKIVTLNEMEVKKRIIKVLIQLSHVGCLHVMKCAIEDDCDAEVSKKATSFTLVVLGKLKHYQITSENVDLGGSSSPAIDTKSDPQLQLHEQMTDKNVGSPKWSNSPFFDPVSPLTPSVCTFHDPNRITPPSSELSSTSETSTQKNAPDTTQSLQENSNYQQQEPSHNSLVFSPGRLEPFNVTSTNQLLPSEDLTNEMNLPEYEYVNIDLTQLNDEASSNGFDSARTQLLLEEFLNSNDITLLQKIYNTKDQVTNNTTQMKTKTYLAASEFLKFVYNEVETHTMEKTQWLNKLDEFDSLLDDILKEYTIEDVNSMDCY